MVRELLLLGLLRQEERHGYQLHEFIESYMQTCVDLKKSTAYYLLEKLEREGLVVSSKEQVGNRPVRQVYQLTPAGEAKFQALLRENVARYFPTRFPGNVGLTFLEALPADEGLALLRQRRERMAEALSQARDAPPHDGSLQIIVEHQIHHLTTQLAWLDVLIGHLRADTERGAGCSEEAQSE